MAIKRGEKIPSKVEEWRGDYILCFRSFFILSKNFIQKAKIAAINFHPAPPEFPGSGCINFALYEESQEYGVTAHIVNEKIDNGEIIDVMKFKIDSNESLDSLLKKTHKNLHILCERIINGISNYGESFIREKIEFSKDIKWHGEARKIKELDKLQLIDPEISEEELKRIIRATYTKNHPPKINLHGFEFILKSCDPTNAKETD